MAIFSQSCRAWVVIIRSLQFDQKVRPLFFRPENSTYLQPPGYVPISSSDPWPLWAAYFPILLSEVEQEQKLSGNGDREAIVAGAGLCNCEGERAYIAYAPHYIFAFRTHIRS